MTQILHSIIRPTPTKADSVSYNPALVFEAGQRNHHIANTAYPIEHKKTVGPYRVNKEEYLSLSTERFANLDTLSLYTHIPFCETRCYFCEYTVVDKKEIDETKRYFDALNQEAEMYSQLLSRRKLTGFDIGGGTPSFPEAKYIASHLAVIKRNFDLQPECEISIETTPRIASLEVDKINAYKEMGIDRISMGVQVTEPDLLKVLGRERNGIEHHYSAVRHIRDAGFQKFNLDLMYGFAGQSNESWLATLKHAIDLDPEFITLYRMRYKLTRISHQANDVNLTQINQQSKIAVKALTDAGYWANPGKNTFSKVSNSTGTSAYLTERVICGQPYLGLGLGAQSFTSSTLSYNSGAAGKILRPYIKSIEADQLPIQDLYVLPYRHSMAKMIAVSFYFGEVNLQAFQNRFGVSLEEVFQPELDFVLSNGYMQYTESKNGQELNIDHHSLSLTEKGAANFNGVIALFFAPSVQEYLLNKYGV